MKLSSCLSKHILRKCCWKGVWHMDKLWDGTSATSILTQNLDLYLPRIFTWTPFWIWMYRWTAFVKKCRMRSRAGWIYSVFEGFDNIHFGLSCTLVLLALVVALTTKLQRCWLDQCWCNIGTVVPMLAQRWPDIHCCPGLIMHNNEGCICSLASVYPYWYTCYAMSNLI